MTNTVDENGIQIDSLSEITDKLEAAYKSIYGSDINLESNSPDGQLMNTFSQAIRDLREYEVSIYNSFDPDVATGVNLDARVAINLLQRRGGTYTTTDVTVTTTQALNLVGLDGSEVPPENVYTIQDSEGNEFYLQDSQSEASAGVFIYSFRSAVSGEVQVLENTLTIPVSVVLGVESVNNPTELTLLGIDIESDQALRLRRQRSTAIVSVGFNESMVSALSNINEIESVLVNENNTPATDAAGIPPHSYWIIVDGGTDQDVAAVINEKRSGGSGMRGNEVVTIIQVDGNPFDILFDRAIPQDIYIRFNIFDIVTGNPMDLDYIKEEIVKNIIYPLGVIANKTDIEAFVKELLPNVYVGACQLSNDNINYFDLLLPTTIQYRFKLDESRIFITDLGA